MTYVEWCFWSEATYKFTKLFLRRFADHNILSAICYLNPSPSSLCFLYLQHSVTLGRTHPPSNVNKTSLLNDFRINNKNLLPMVAGNNVDVGGTPSQRSQREMVNIFHHQASGAPKWWLTQKKTHSCNQKGKIGVFGGTSPEVTLQKYSIENYGE